MAFRSLLLYFCFTLIIFNLFYLKLLSINACLKGAHLNRNKIRNKEKLLFKKKRVRVIVFVQDEGKKLENFTWVQYGSTWVQYGSTLVQVLIYLEERHMNILPILWDIYC